MTVNEPQPGDFAVVRMNNQAGRLIRLGQWLNDNSFADYEHAFILVSNDQLMEAEPGGARRTPLANYDNRPTVWSSGRIPLTDDQRTRIVAAAEHYLGTPYSFADYLALAAHRLHLPIPWLRRYVQSSHHMICSQLVDQAYRDAGVQLFHDGHWPGYVTPADLYQLLAQEQQ